MFYVHDCAAWGLGRERLLRQKGHSREPRYKGENLGYLRDKINFLTKICILADGTSTQHSNQKQRMKKTVKVNAIYVSLSMYLPICTYIITFVYIYTVYPSIYIYIYIYI